MISSHITCIYSGPHGFNWAHFWLKMIGLTSLFILDNVQVTTPGQQLSSSALHTNNMNAAQYQKNIGDLYSVSMASIRPVPGSKWPYWDPVQPSKACKRRWRRTMVLAILVSWQNYTYCSISRHVSLKSGWFLAQNDLIHALVNFRRFVYYCRFRNMAMCENW